VNPRPKVPRWLLAGLLLLSGFYFMEHPVIRFGTAGAGVALTGQEQIANLLVAATVATLLFIAIRAISAAVDRK
jgi:hypothetical protein